MASNETSLSQPLNQPWKALYRPTSIPTSDLSFVWPITFAAFASGNDAKSMICDVDLMAPKGKKCGQSCNKNELSRG